MPEETMERLLAFFKALADETRLKLLGLLATRECSVEEIAANLGVKEPTVSHHIGRLKDLNLVHLRTEGNSRYYSLNRESLRALSKDVLTPETIATAAAPELDDDKFARKVMQTFMEGGRIKTQLPVQRKKREVLLNWLVQHFEHGREYRESEVNAIIKQFHDDTATLRREMIMTGLMRRRDGMHGVESVYWR